MMDQPGSYGNTLREWCLRNIEKDLAEGIRTPADSELLNVLVNYFSKFTFSSMSDMYGLQILAQRWSHREGWQEGWKRVWPCCARCAQTKWQAGPIVAPEPGPVGICADCGSEADGSFFILRSLSEAKTTPAEYRAFDRRPASLGGYGGN